MNDTRIPDQAVDWFVDYQRRWEDLYGGWPPPEVWSSMIAVMKALQRTLR